MGLCEYCDEKAGWLQSSHPACVAKAESTGRILKDMVFNETLTGKSYEDLSTEVQQALSDAKVQLKYVTVEILQGVNDAASKLALQSPIPVTEFDRLWAILNGFGITAYQAEHASRRWYAVAQILMSYILWHVMHNEAPPFDGSVDFNLRPDETPIYQTGDCVTYSEERTISTSVRSFSGLSLPVGRGIYYHIGGSQGHQERTSGLVPLDGGKILITSHSLYFGGQTTTLRIPLDRVLRYQPYVDGVGVCESHGKPKVFVFDYRGMDTGWFFYNVLCALTKQPQSNEAGGVEPDIIQKAQRAVVQLQSAFDAWSAANDKFTDLFKTPVDVKAITVSTEDVEVYTTAVMSLFAAAHKLEENCQFVSKAARDKYCRALQSVETRWATFASADDGHMNGDAFVPFLNDLAAFMKSRNEFCASDIRLSSTFRPQRLK